MSERANNLLSHIAVNVSPGAKLTVNVLASKRDGGLEHIDGKLVFVDVEDNVLVLNGEFMGMTFTRLIAGDKIVGVDII